jgi:hypothetical protein
MSSSCFSKLSNSMALLAEEFFSHVQSYNEGVVGRNFNFV